VSLTSSLYPVAHGARIAICRPSPRWFTLAASWVSDPQINRTLITATPWPLEPAQMPAWLPVAEPPTAFLIALQGTLDRPIGMSHFHSFDERSKSIKLAILLEPNFQGQGLGSEAVAVMLEYAFKTFDLHRVSLSAFSSNPAGLRAYERAGFRFEGVRRKAWFRDGEWHDDVVMAVLRSEWQERA
jgi:RimJ/RimL family protein N-acetyltransferase